MSSCPEFPPELRQRNYPQELLIDLIPDMGCAHRIQEGYARMARYALVQYLQLPFADEKTLAIARGETKEKSFNAAVRKAWTGIHGNGAGLENGDIELAADELGVLEFIDPFDEDKMHQSGRRESRRKSLTAMI